MKIKTLSTIAIGLGCLVASTVGIAACKNVWVDHDYNISTPPVQTQVCDSTLDLPAINLPGVQPIQSPGLRPLEPVGLTPLGTTQCTTQRVYEYGQWVEKRLCR